MWIRWRIMSELSSQLGPTRTRRFTKYTRYTSEYRWYESICMITCILIPHWYTFKMVMYTSRMACITSCICTRDMLTSISLMNTRYLGTDQYIPCICHTDIDSWYGGCILFWLTGYHCWEYTTTSPLTSDSMRKLYRSGCTDAIL